MEQLDLFREAHQVRCVITYVVEGRQL